MSHDPVGRSHSLAETWTNGLSLITGRGFFDSGQGGFDVACRACQEHTEMATVCTYRHCERYRSTGRLANKALKEAWIAAIDEWWDAEAPVKLACPRCGHQEPLTDWIHDPPQGYGWLGFKFWNWPALTPEFVAEVGRQLGHRVVLVGGSCSLPGRRPATDGQAGGRTVVTHSLSPTLTSHRRWICISAIRHLPPAMRADRAAAESRARAR